ncbi:MAG: sigma-54-dependent Fis family transcriptional regulator, partial [Planctomycetales bacterium]|nr:sigma-54-dependent Fis family transcriptional regulator [Planctomycetales bacterium]
FREDLYWRLNVVPITVPPLRSRREDIPALVAFFLNQYSEANDRYVVHINPQAMEAMQEYHWPGNVRELQNYVERAVVMAESDELTVDLLPDVVLGRQPMRAAPSRGADLESLTYEVVQHGLATSGPEEDSLHTKIVSRVERELIAQVMLNCDNVQTKAAKRLGINRNTLHKKLKEYGLESSE